MSFLIIPTLLVFVVVAIPVSVIVYLVQSSRVRKILSLTNSTVVTIPASASALPLVVPLNSILDINTSLYDYDIATQNITFRRNGNYLFTFNLNPDADVSGDLQITASLNLFDTINDRSVVFSTQSVTKTSIETYTSQLIGTTVAYVGYGTYRLSLNFTVSNTPTSRALSSPTERLSIRYLF